jgi:hypothetical protein
MVTDDGLLVYYFQLLAECSASSDDNTGSFKQQQPVLSAKNGQGVGDGVRARSSSASAAAGAHTTTNYQELGSQQSIGEWTHNGI